MRLHNSTDEQVKACIYTTTSALDVIPCEGGVIFLEPSASQTWEPAPSERALTFDVRFFNPQLVDKLLARASDVSKEAGVRLYRESKDYKADVTASG